MFDWNGYLKSPSGRYSVEGRDFIHFLEVDTLGIICKSQSPIGRFLGQPLEVLTQWIRRTGFEPVIHKIE